MMKYLIFHIKGILKVVSRHNDASLTDAKAMKGSMNFLFTSPRVSKRGLCVKNSVYALQ
jgi:hypothetical protein